MVNKWDGIDTGKVIEVDFQKERWDGIKRPWLKKEGQIIYDPSFINNEKIYKPGNEVTLKPIWTLIENTCISCNYCLDATFFYAWNNPADVDILTWKHFFCTHPDYAFKNKQEMIISILEDLWYIVNEEFLNEHQLTASERKNPITWEIEIFFDVIDSQWDSMFSWAILKDSPAAYYEHCEKIHDDRIWDYSNCENFEKKNEKKQIINKKYYLIKKKVSKLTSFFNICLDIIFMIRFIIISKCK